MIRLTRAALVIARRDFTATVLSKTFIFFLLGPLFPLLLGGVFGGIGAHVATRTEVPVIAVIMPSADFAELDRARDQLASAMESGAVRLIRIDAQSDAAAQRKRLLTQSNPPVRAVLYASRDKPRLIGDVRLTGDVRPGDVTAAQVELILRTANEGAAAKPLVAIESTAVSSGSLARSRALTAQIGQSALFFLTLLLAGMLLSQLIEEKSNKIIEVIASAVSIDAMFIGKLLAMLAASVIGIMLWVGAGALIIQWTKSGGLATLPPPAIGWPGFLFLSILYFATNYLLLGSVFLTIGAQASTVRQVQTLSMPVTFAQVLLFGFASTAVGAANSPQGIAAAIFPLSSPMAMLARAAEDPAWTPHFAALVWQGLWVAVILNLGARLFRKTVLKSGPQGRVRRKARV